MFETLYNKYKHLGYDHPEIIVTDTHALMTRVTFEKLKSNIFSCAYGATCYLAWNGMTPAILLVSIDRSPALEVLIIEDLDPEKSDREFYLDARRRLDEARSKPYDQ